MYVYHALINALSAHMIHINLNMIFYTHVEQSPTKTIYIKYYAEKQTNTRTCLFQIILFGSNDLVAPSEQCNGTGMCCVQPPPSKTPVDVQPWKCQSERK